MGFPGKINTAILSSTGITTILSGYIRVKTCVANKRNTTQVLHTRQTRRGGFRSQLSA